MDTEEIVKLRAENKKLRYALIKMFRAFGPSSERDTSIEDGAIKMREAYYAARKALEE